MKFGEYLRTHLTSEWSSQYIAYEDMKELFAEVISKAPPIIENNRSSSRERYFLLADEEYFQYCEREASKINTFFAEKLAEALLRFNLLKDELECIEQTSKQRHLVVTNVLYTKRSETSVNNPDSIGENSGNLLINNLRRNRSDSVIHRKQMKRHRYQKMNDLKLAFSEFYLMLILIKNYQTLNFTGFRKILKKHDKLYKTTRGNEWRMSYIDCAPFHTSVRVDQLMNEVETLYTNVLESGDRARAMQRLRVPPLEEKQPRIVTFRLGMYIGMLCILFPLLILIGVALYGPQSSKAVNWQAALHLYRSSFFIILHIIFFGINVYGWSTSGVNHVLIFEVDPRNHLSYQKFLELGTFLMVIWFVSLNAFMVSFYLNFYPFAQPFIFVVFLIVFLINPIQRCYHKARLWFVKTLFRILLAPFFHVGFADFWLADQLCSLELVFFDIEYFICFYITDTNWTSWSSTNTFFCSGWSQVALQTFFIILPSWFRLAQCLRRYRDTKQKFPHLVNAGKYASSFFVSAANALRRAKIFDYHQNKLENPFLYIWIITALFSSTYKVLWDIKMDWGFFDKNAGENKYLREQIVYPRKVYYYVAIVGNILLRYIWLVNIFLHFNNLFAEYSDIIGFSFGLIEIFRRFVWNYFRLENEHLTNCGEFRAVRDISIRPTPTANNSQQQLGTNRNDNRTTVIEIPMTTINDSSEVLPASLIRRKTNAEQFIDEMNTVLTVEPNMHSSLENSTC